jgi:hypothetical protein
MRHARTVGDTLLWFPTIPEAFAATPCWCWPVMARAGGSEHWRGGTHRRAGRSARVSARSGTDLGRSARPAGGIVSCAGRSEHSSRRCAAWRAHIGVAGAACNLSPAPPSSQTATSRPRHSTTRSGRRLPDIFTRHLGSVRWLWASARARPVIYPSSRPSVRAFTPRFRPFQPRCTPFPPR